MRSFNEGASPTVALAEPGALHRTIVTAKEGQSHQVAKALARDVDHLGATLDAATGTTHAPSQALAPDALDRAAITPTDPAGRSRMVMPRVLARMESYELAKALVGEIPPLHTYCVSSAGDGLGSGGSVLFL